MCGAVRPYLKILVSNAIERMVPQAVKGGWVDQGEVRGAKMNTQNECGQNNNVRKQKQNIPSRSTGPGRR